MALVCFILVFFSLICAQNIVIIKSITHPLDIFQLSLHLWCSCSLHNYLSSGVISLTLLFFGHPIGPTSRQSLGPELWSIPLVERNASMTGRPCSHFSLPTLIKIWKRSAKVPWSQSRSPPLPPRNPLSHSIFDSRPAICPWSRKKVTVMLLALCASYSQHAGRIANVYISHGQLQINNNHNE